VQKRKRQARLLLGVALASFFLGSGRPVTESSEGYSELGETLVIEVNPRQNQPVCQENFNQTFGSEPYPCSTRDFAKWQKRHLIFKCGEKYLKWVVIFRPPAFSKFGPYMGECRGYVKETEDER